MLSLSRHLITLMLAVPLASTLFLACGGAEDERDCLHSAEPCACRGYTDCGPAPACQYFACAYNLCVLAPAPAKINCGEKNVCDGTGRCVECIEDTDCGSGRCWKGACIQCDDGVQNGDETGVDCGGGCGKCPGDTCIQDKECQKGGCYHGLCCPVPCPGCNRCDTTGTCVPLPQFTDDNPNCMFDSSCNGQGQCGLNPYKPCTYDMDCASLRCSQGQCTVN